jgi:hypothetical protein
MKAGFTRMISAENKVFPSLLTLCLCGEKYIWILAIKKAAAEAAALGDDGIKRERLVIHAAAHAPAAAAAG